MTTAQPGQEQRMEPFVSLSCGGEHCHCGKPAVRKVGEEILAGDPMPNRHNLTAYVCAQHYAELMGPAGARQVGYTRPTADLGEDGELVAAIQRHIAEAETHPPGGSRELVSKQTIRAVLNARAVLSRSGG